MIDELMALQEYLEEEGLYIYIALEDMNGTNAGFFVREDK